MRFDQLIKEYNRLGINIQRLINHSDSKSVLFSNGDLWQVCKATDSQRGAACNISLIEYDIPLEIINCIIKPCTKAYPYQAYNYYGRYKEE